jgi:glycosyltransferase 2 family protein
MWFASLFSRSPLYSAEVKTSGRSWLSVAVKLAAAIALVAYLIKREHIAWEPLRASLVQWQLSIPAFILLFFTPFAQLWRWQSLLRARQLHLPTLEVFTFLMVSKFLNMALPGHIGGDVLRGVFISKRSSELSAQENSGPAAGPFAVVPSIFFDRMFGVVALLVFCLLGTVGNVYHPLLRWEFVLPVSLMAALGLLAGFGLLWLAYVRPEPPELLMRLFAKIRLSGIFSELYRGTHEYARDKKLIRKIALISFGSQSIILISLIMFGVALGMDVSLTEYLVLVPVGLMLTTIPITPASLGVGQVAFLALFRLAGSAQGANLFTLYMISQVLINLSGAVLLPMLRMPDNVPAIGNLQRADKRQ